MGVAQVVEADAGHVELGDGTPALPRPSVSENRGVGTSASSRCKELSDRSPGLRYATGVQVRQEAYVTGSVQNGGMPTGELTIETDHLDRLVKRNVPAGLAELVWNSLDAEATQVDITVRLTALGAVDRVIVSDDGHGFGPHDVNDLMSSLGGSWKATKADRKTKHSKRILHGSKGEGRFQAFCLGDLVRWESVVQEDGGRQLTELTIRRPDLKRFGWTTQSTERSVGTTVTVSAGSQEPRALTQEGASRRLLERLALYLTQHPDVEVKFNDDPLDPDPLIDHRETLPAAYSDEHGTLSVSVIEWHDQVDRALFLCDANGITLHQMPPGIHAPGFHFTAYAKWDGFRVHESDLLLADTGLPETLGAIEASRDALRKHFQQRVIERNRLLVDEWRDENVHPYPDPPADNAERAEQALFNYVAVTAATAVNSIDNHRAKALSLQTMKLALAQDPDAVELVFREVLALPEDKLNELRDLLSRTSLAALVGAMKMVTDRLRYIRGLQEMLFDAETASEVLERAHLHDIIGSEPWLFGEEYALHVSDQGLTKLLNAHLGLLGRDAAASEPVRDADGRVRRIDFLFARALEQNRNRREHLVVEIKRPTVKLGEGELLQVERFARTVAGDSRFDSDTTEWDFLLVSNEMDDYVHDRANQPDKPKGLAFETPSRRLRVWVKGWSTILAEAEHRMKFVREQLKYDPGSEDAIEYLKENYPECVPAIVHSPQQAS